MALFESKKAKAARIAKENLEYRIQLQMECDNYNTEIQNHKNSMKKYYNEIAAYKAAGNDREAQEIYRKYKRSENAARMYEDACNRAQDAIIITDIATSEARLASVVPKLLDKADIDNLKLNRAQTDAKLKKAKMMMNTDNSQDLAFDAEFAKFYNSIPAGNTSTTENNQGLADLRTQLEQAKRG